MEQLMNDIGYVFKDVSILTKAITHSSYANENECESYERLEFLGDSILSYIVSKHLYSSKQEIPEGEMSKLRAAIVCERSLNECAKKLNIGEYLILSKGEEQTGGRSRTSILADVFEAILAAVYLDAGLEEAEKFVFRFLGNEIKKGCQGISLYTDYKTELQEIIQSVGKKVTYNHIKEEGPAHDKRFTVQVVCEDKVIATGVGRSKKDAEQNAASIAVTEVKNVKI